MSNPNPFVPKGSLLEQQSQRRSRLKIAVLCVVVVGATGLMAMLIEGCKRDNGNTGDQSGLDQSTNVVDNGSNAVPPMIDSNNPVATGVPGGPGQLPAPGMGLPPGAPPPSGVPGAGAQAPVTGAQVPTTIPTGVPTTEPEATGGGEYVIVSGDTLGKIAKKNGVSLKALEAANPGVDSRHLRVGKKLVIPTGGTAPEAAGTTGGATATDMAADAGTGTVYTVKSGDTLHKIARKFGVSVKAIQEANNLSSTRINVGKKLKIPGKAEAAPVVPSAPETNVPAVPAPLPAVPSSAPAPGAPANH